MRPRLNFYKKIIIKMKSVCATLLIINPYVAFGPSGDYQEQKHHRFTNREENIKQRKISNKFTNKSIKFANNVFHTLCAS
jgi:hypothetical protein